MPSLLNLQRYVASFVDCIDIRKEEPLTMLNLPCTIKAIYTYV